MLSRRTFLGVSLGAARLRAQRPAVISGVDAASRGYMASRAVTVPGRVQPVLTRSGGNIRWGGYLNETVLTPASVVASPPRLLYAMKVPGDPRIEAQPLLAPNVTTEDGTVHDLCIVATMSGGVCAFDANDASLLWFKRLGQFIQGTRAIDDYLVNNGWSVLSTPVVDAGIVYVVAWISPDATPAQGRFWLYALSLADGSRAKPPLVLTAVDTVIQRKQRSALTVTTVGGRRTIFVPYCTIQEMNTSPPAHGYVQAVDIADWKVRAEWNVTPTGFGGGIWQSGQGLITDDAGNIWLLTGNGDFDGAGNFGECFVRLAYDYTAATLKPAEWWSPWLDSARGARGDPNGFNDMDLGSAPPAVIPALNAAIVSGKDSIAYVAPVKPLGTMTVADIASGANYNKLRSHPIWYGYFNPRLDAQPPSAAALNFFYAQRTHNIHSGSVVFKSAAGWLVYCFAENNNARAWSIDATGTLKFLANGAEMASAESPVPPGGMPGGMMALSASGMENAILWATVPLGNANQIVTQGYLVAYDAINFGRYSDGTGQLRTLWKSNAFVFSKFNPPVISGGRVFVPTYDGQVLVFG